MISPQDSHCAPSKWKSAMEFDDTLPLPRIHRRDASVLVRPGIRGDGSVGHGFDPDRLGRVRGVRATPRGFLTARSSGGGRDCQIAGNRRHSGPTWRGSARGLAGKPLAGFCTTPSRRITVVYGVIVYAIRFKTPSLHL